MELIAELSEFIIDELSAIKKYVKMAMEYKAIDKELADMFYGMANNEMTHLRNLHTWEVKLIEKKSKDPSQEVPKGMTDVWKWKHKRMISEFTEAEIMLQSYQKF